MAQRPYPWCPPNRKSWVLGLFACLTAVWIRSDFVFLRCSLYIPRYRALAIKSSRFFHHDKLTKSLISFLNITWYLSFFISSPTVYYETNKALSWNLEVISFTVSVVWRRSSNSLASSYTSIVAGKSSLNLITNSFQVMATTAAHPNARPTSSHQSWARSLRRQDTNPTFTPLGQKLVRWAFSMLTIQRRKEMGSLALMNSWAPHA